MATTASPYGLLPVKRVDGLPFAGHFRQYKIASAYGANIYNGSIVQIVSDGTIEIVTTVGSAGSGFPAGTIGVFVGCQYTDPNLGYLLQRNYWPTGTVASDAVGFVVDDPNVLFQAQCDEALTSAAIGQNIYLAAAQSTSTGSTMTGKSNTALDASTSASTTGLALRVVEFVESETSTAGDAYTDVLVKFNVGSHIMTNAAGV